MKISKLFHWLYAILMFLPFMAVAFNLVRLSFSGDLTILTYDEVFALLKFPQYYGGSLYLTIYNVYFYLANNLFGLDTSTVCTLITQLLTYWTFTSIVYLIFDVLMYVPLLVHRWIDKARLE